MSHRRGCCCQRTCWSCSGCCYSIYSRVSIAWDITDLLEAYIAEHGADEGTAWWANHAVGSYDDIPLYDLAADTDFLWSPLVEALQFTASARRYCQDTSNWAEGWTAGATWFWDSEPTSRSGWSNTNGAELTFDGGCCGTDGEIEIAASFSSQVGGVPTVTVGTALVTVAVSNNRCQDADRGDVTVSGTLDPDAAGEYDIAGTYNGRTYYKHRTADWYLWYAFDFGPVKIWYISAAAGDTSGEFWTHGKADPDSELGSDYAPNNGASGTATVQVMPVCESAETDQCP